MSGSPCSMRTMALAWVVGLPLAFGCGGSEGGDQPDPGTVPDVVENVDLAQPDKGPGQDPGQVDDPGAPVDLGPEQAPDPGTDVIGDTGKDVACIPQCTDMECGDDGCGDVCGYCPYGFLCKAGLCIEYCVPDCEGKACGDDGCGGYCADCPENEHCAPDFTCVLDSCVPQCGVVECGPDGCGGDCGGCDDGFVCLGGECKEDTSCYDVTAEGLCEGDLLVWCADGVLQKLTCDSGAGLFCGYSHLAKKYDCITPEQCEPQCVDKDCGPDLCGGECGQCAGIEVCSSGGDCGPPCGEVTETGTCEGDILSFCHQGILIVYDCGAAAKTCQWDPTGNSGQGWFDCL